MLCNKNTVLVGKKILLVPYRIEHVAKYHAWMENEELRTLTASEPLTLDQEYDMQRKWQMDEDKLTFIILAREGDAFIPDTVNPTDSQVSSLPMVGDVNIFFSGTPHSVSESTNRPPFDDSQEFTAEAEIMIAGNSQLHRPIYDYLKEKSPEPLYRRRGYAKEALRLMFEYVTGRPTSYFIQNPRVEMSQGEETRQISVKMPHSIPPTSLITRISDTNTPSIKLFEKLGFRITKHVEVFEEVELRWNAL